MIAGRHKRKNENYEKTSLYIIENSETIEFSDASGDSATIAYQINEGQHGLYAHEFRPEQVPKADSKVIDLSMGIEDFENKKCIWGLYDLKRTLGGKDDALKLGGQWQAGLRYWYNSVLNYLDGYTKSGRIGVVTTTDAMDRIDEHIKTLRQEINDAEKLNGTLVGAKMNSDIIRTKKELSFFERFSKKEFIYSDPDGNEEVWSFDVIVSPHYVFEWKISG